MITAPEEKCLLFNVIPKMLEEIMHIQQTKIRNQEQEPYNIQAIMKMF